MSSSALLAGGLGSLGLAIALLVIAMVPARSRQHGIAGALTAIEQRYARHAPSAAPRASDPFAAVPRWVRGLAIRLSPSGTASALQRKLDLAGNPARWTPDRILAVKGLGLLVLGGLGALYGLRSLGLLFLCAGLGAAVGFFLPDILLHNAGVKRQARIQALLPDALDMLTVCVEAGLGFDAALSQVARNSHGPLAAEFARALQEMQIGTSRSQALRALVARTTVPELRAFVSALVQASDLGIAVATVLREQAKEMRLRRRQRAEEKAQKVPVKILFPLIFCLFPSLLVAIIGPGVISIAHSVFGR
jgi:tight adherence protein C